MVRAITSVLIGFISWLAALIVGEQILSLLLPVQFGAPQAAFQDAIENGSQFTSQTLHLAIHVLLAILACLAAGFVTGLVSRDTKRASFILGWLLVVLGVVKAAITWQLVPVWYHLAFTGVLFPATLLGEALRPARTKRD